MKQTYPKIKLLLEDNHKPFILTDIQESFLIGKYWKNEQDMIGCHAYVEVEVENLDIQKLNDTWNYLVRHHDMLRDQVLLDGVQQIQSEEDGYVIKVNDLSQGNEELVLNHLKETRKTLSHKVYECDDFPLYTLWVSCLPKEKYIIHLSMDEWIVDAYSIKLLLNQWQQLYNGELKKLKPLSLTFRDFVLALESFKSTDRYQRDQKYWLNKLKPKYFSTKVLELPKEAIKAEEQDYFERKEYSKLLDPDQWKTLKRIAKNLNVSVSAILLAAFTQVTKLLAKGEAHSLITTYFNRLPLHPEMNEVVGPFISTHVFCIEKNLSDEKVSDLYMDVQEQLWENNEHSSYTGVTAIRELKTNKILSKETTIPIVFTSLVNNLADSKIGNWFDNTLYSITQTPQVFLDNQLIERNGTLSIRWDVVPEAFPNQDVTTYFDLYVKLIEGIGSVSQNLAKKKMKTDTAKTKDEMFVAQQNLTALQQSLLYLNLLGAEKEKSACTIYQAFEVANLDLQKLNAAWLKLLNTHQMLRASFSEEGDLMIGKSLKDYPIQVIENTEAAIGKVVDKTFNPKVWPLFEIAVSHEKQNKSWVHLNINVLLADGKSLFLLYEQLFQLYQNIDSDIFTSSDTFTSYLNTIAQEGKVESTHLKYWKERYKNITGTPICTGLDQNKKGTKKRITRRIKGTKQLTILAKENKIDKTAILFATYIHTLQSCLKKAEDFPVTFVDWGRPTLSEMNLDNIVGDFSSISLHIAQPLDLPIIDKAKAIHQRLGNDRKNQAQNSFRVLNKTLLNNNVQSNFVFTNIIAEDLVLPPQVKMAKGLSCTPGVFLDNITFLEKDEIVINWDYDSAAWEADYIQNLFDQYTQYLETTIHDLDPTTETILETSNPNEQVGMCIHHLFEHQVRQHGKRIALKYNEEAITYEDLNEKANRLAHFLIEQGIGSEDLVGLIFERSIDTIIAILAVLKAGAAYLPLDVAYPKARYTYIIEDAKVKAILSKKNLAEVIPMNNAPFFFIEEIEVETNKHSIANPEAEVQAHNLAYVIYTSGSTGKPKGVMVSHNNVRRLFTTSDELYDFSEHDVWSFYHSFAFDFSVWEIWGALLYGGKLVIVPYKISRSFESFYKLVEKERVTVLNQTPTAFRQFIQVDRQEGLSTKQSSLRYVIFGGEALEFHALKKWMDKYGDQQPQLINMYGITETTVHVTFKRILIDDLKNTDSNIGKPLPDLDVIIVDQNNKRVKEGEVGEILVVGPGVSRGYLRRDKLNQERFLQDTFIRPNENQRMYKSGDLGAFLPNGEIKYIGRADTQVKVRGFRIELGEIESVIAEYEGVDDVVVIVQDKKTEDPKIVAYLIMNHQQSAIKLKELKEVLKVKLPLYMIPNVIKEIETFPLTVNGKIDLKKLPWPVQSDMLLGHKLQTRNNAPSHVIDFQELKNIIQIRLKMVEVGEEEDFFDLGCTSLTILQIAKDISKTYKLKIPTEVFLETPTIAALKDYIRKNNKTISKEKRPFSPMAKITSRSNIYIFEFAQVCNIFRRRGEKDYFQYPSAGGKYAVKVYLFIKEGVLDGIKEGFYEYNASSHTLHLKSIVTSNQIEQTVPDYYRQEFEYADYLVFFAVDLRGLKHIYGASSNFLASVECGYMQRLLAVNTQRFNLQSTALDIVYFDQLLDIIKFEEHHCFIAASAVKHESSTPLVDILLKDRQSLIIEDTYDFNQLPEINSVSSEDFIHLEENKKIEIEKAYKETVKEEYSQCIERIELPLGDWIDSDYLYRQSKRSFEKDLIDIEDLNALLDLLYKFYEQGEMIGLDVYLYLKKDKVHGLEAGYYYYDVSNRKLKSLNKKSSKDLKKLHSPFNRTHYAKAAFSLFFIANIAELETIYRKMALRQAALKVGSFGQELMDKQYQFNIGLCPIGGFYFDTVHTDLGLSSKENLVHSFIGGGFDYKNEVAKDLLDQRPNLSQDVAIIGAACRFPGANTLSELWDVLSNGVSKIRPLPTERLKLRNGTWTDDGVYSTWGGYLENISSFDNELFKISPKEAKAIDPQERILLEVVWECLEASGYRADTLEANGDRVGVFTGMMWNDYQHIGLESTQSGEEVNIPGLAASLANRISHSFNFTGPSIVVNTSCSASLTALNLAWDSLQGGSCEFAIVAGVNLICHPYHQEALCANKILSKGEKGCAFSEVADGLVIGEGVGVVLLKKQDIAIQCKDNILGTIKGVASNHIGKSRRFGMSNANGIYKSLKTLFQRTAIDPTTLDYIESAATGSSIGDAAEVGAIHKLLQEVNSDHQYLMGSIKPNIGHQESASGIAQIIKVLLQFRHQQIAPSLYATPISPLIEDSQDLLKINQTLSPFIKNEKSKPYRVLINSIGSTGSASHVILDAAPDREIVQEEDQMTLIKLSAASTEQLKEYSNRLLNYLLETASVPSLQTIGLNLEQGRQLMKVRLVIVAESISDLKNKLLSFCEDKIVQGLYTDPTFDRSNLKEQHTKGILNWLEGVDLNKNHKGGVKYQKISLPTYPFKQNSFWAYTNAIPNTAKGKQKEQTAIRSNETVGDFKAPLIEYLIDIFSKVTEFEKTSIDQATPFEDYGLTSKMIEELNHLLENKFGTLSKTIFFEGKNLKEISELLVKYRPEIKKHFQSKPIKPQPEKAFCNSSEIIKNIKRSITVHTDDVVTKKINHLSAKQDASNTDLAIVGMNGRFPKAKNIDEFWTNLKIGKDCIEEVPKHRWDYAPFYHPDKNNRGTIYSKWGGFIDDVDQFDAKFFGISPVEAEMLDPQERMFLECAYSAMEDAGYTKERIRKEFDGKVGVFVGVMYSEYAHLGVEQIQQGNNVSLGAGYGSIANRVSYFLDLNGPSIALDTMCSSSLSALSLAVDAIKLGHCEMAIVGAVNLSLHPNKYLMHAQMNMVSEGGKCKAFGENADGFVAGEGIGAIIITRESIALAQKDNIYGIIKSVAINHDGKTNGYTVPNPVMQTALVESALNTAQIDPRSITYIEAHGTGTSLGDPIEITGLTNAFMSFTQDKQFCAIGSVKSNIGHLEAASGIAGIIKVLLQMKYQMLVPSINVDALNENINFADTPFKVQRQLETWEQIVLPDHNKELKLFPRRAGISSFGAGGMNSHVILEEYPGVERTLVQNPGMTSLIVLSAKNGAALSQQVVLLIEKVQQYLDENSRKYFSESSLKKIISRLLGLSPNEMDTSLTLTNIGFDRKRLTALQEEMKRDFDIEIKEEWFFSDLSFLALYEEIVSENKIEDNDLLKVKEIQYLKDIAFTLQVGRTAFQHRLAITTTDLDDLLITLKAYTSDNASLPVNIFEKNTGKNTFKDLDFSNIESLLEKEDWTALAEVWVNGGTVEWDKIKSHDKAYKIALPTYPFNRKPYWVPGTDNPSTPPSKRRVSERKKTVKEPLSLVKHTESNIVTTRALNRKSDPVKTYATAEKKQEVSYGEDTFVVDQVVETIESNAEAFSQETEIFCWEELVFLFDDLLKVPADEISPNEELSTYGFDSIATTRLQYLLQERWNIDVGTKEIFECTTVEDLHHFLVNIYTEGKVLDHPIRMDKQEKETNILKTINKTVFPLSDIQQSFLSGKFLTKDKVGCHFYCEIKFLEVNLAKLEKAWNVLMDRHGMLRMKINRKGTQELITSTSNYSIKSTNIAKDFSDHNDQLIKTRNRLSHYYYEPDSWPYFTIEVSQFTDAAVLHFSIDEWIADAKSLDLLFQEWRTLYVGGQELEPLMNTFQEYLELSIVSGTPRKERAYDYWKNKLTKQEVSSECSLQIKDKEPSDKGYYERVSRSYILAANEWSYLKKQSQTLGITPTALLLSIYTTVLFHKKQKAATSILLTLFNRLPIVKDVDRLVGPFISSSIFVSQSQRDIPFFDYLKSVQDQLWEDIDNSILSGVSVLRKIKKEKLIATNYNIPFVFTSMLNNIGKEEGENWLAQTNYQLTQTPQILIDHQVFEKNDELYLKFDYIPELFDEMELANLFQTYFNVLSRMSRNTLKKDLVLKDFIQEIETTTNSFGFLEELNLSTLYKKDVSIGVDLTALQQAYCFGRKKYAGKKSESSKIYYEFNFNDLEIPRLEKVLNTLIQNHGMLRTLINARKLTQQVLQEVPFYKIKETTFSTENQDKALKLEALRLEYLEKNIDEAEWPLFECFVSHFADKQTIVHFVFDSLIVDGQSLSLFFDQLFQMYADEQISIAFPKLQFSDYLRTSKEFESSQGIKLARQYWTDKFRTISPAPSFKVNIEEQKIGSERIRHEGSISDWGILKSALLNRSIDPGMFLFSVFQYIIDRFSDTSQQKSTLVLVNWDRPVFHSDIEKILGEFTSISWIENQKYDSFLSRIDNNVQKNKSDIFHSLLSPLSILQKVAREKGDKALNFPIVFTNLAKSLVHSGKAEFSFSSTVTPNVYLDVLNFEQDGTLHFHWDETQNIFSKGLIEEMFQTYQDLIRQLSSDITLLDNQQFSLAEITKPMMVTTRKINPAHTTVSTDSLDLLEQWNDTAQAYDLSTPLFRLFENQVTQQAEHPAIYFEDQVLTYKTLNIYANRLADYLREEVKANDVVGVILNRSVEMVVTLLAIEKAGAAYLPIDPSMPKKRIAYMLENANVGTVILHQSLEDLIPDFQRRVLNLDKNPVHLSEKYLSENKDLNIDQEDLSYVIYTSGSTGNPKGCMVPHRAITNRILWMQDLYQLSPQDRILQKTPYSFDVSVWEFFWPLMAGATIVVAKPNGHKSPRYLVEVINKYKVSVCHFVPSMFRVFLNDVKSKSCESLRYVFTSGEALTYDLLERFVDGFESRLINLYGPTEAAVDVTYWECHKNHDQRVPIGKAIANIQMYVLDKQLKPVEIGASGEIYIGGVGLAHGYLNNLELTKERFINNPFDPTGTSKLYKTGDEGCFTEDGNIEYLGRLDFQVKIRGLRIELEEIEVTIRNMEEVDEAAVLVRNQEKNDPILVAYVKCIERISDEQIKGRLLKKLPDYFVPQRFVRMDEMPTTLHGKLDRKQLPWPVKKTTLTQPIQEKEGKQEIIAFLTKALKDTLDLAHLEEETDLFAAGATSLSLINALQDLSDEYPDVDIPVEVILEDSNIKAIGVWLDENYMDSNKPEFTKRSKTSFAQLSQLIGQLKSIEYNGKTQYAFPSAGGVYALQSYIFIPSGKVDGLEEGAYYFHPTENALYQITSESSRMDWFKNENKDADFFVFFVGCLDAIEPLYLNYSKSFMTLDSGYAGQLLKQASSNTGLRLQSFIPNSTEDLIAAFQLPDNAVFTYGLAGCQLESDQTEIAFSAPTNFDFRDFRDLQKLQYSRMSEAEKKAFQNKQIQLRNLPDAKKINLLSSPDWPDTDYYLGRSSKRQYTQDLIPLDTLTTYLANALDKNLTTDLSVLQTNEVKVLLYIKPNRIENLEAGYYQYDHLNKHKLKLIKAIDDASLVNAHTPFNRKQYTESAFSIFLFTEPDRLQEKFGAGAFHVSLIQSAAIGQKLLASQKSYDLGICPIGGFNFKIFQKQLAMPAEQLLIHSFVGGGYDYTTKVDMSEVQVVNPSQIQEHSKPRTTTDIAIVGMNGQFPMADDLDTFWENITQGKNCLSSVPEDRWNTLTDQFGGFIKNIDQFDASFFGINEYEADYMDPQVRLLIEQVYRVMEDAGEVVDFSKNSKLSGKNIGVFMGCMYEHYPLLAKTEVSKNLLSLHSYSSLVNRISYHLNLTGPSIAIDTACSSSLMAIHMACEHILSGACKAAVAGGINLSLHPAKYEALEQLGLISLDTSSSKSFGRSDGYVPSEGLGVVYLKPLADAVADKNHIYGVIKANASNHSGRTSSYSTPSSNSYLELLEKTFASAKIDPASINYIEAAANGSPIGDQIEFKALKDFYAKYLKDRKITIGSVKANLGHLEAASGVSQLIKVLLQFKHKKLVPSIHHQPINPQIKIDNSPFVFQETLSDWIKEVDDSNLRAGVGSFGAGGSNVYIVLEDYPGTQTERTQTQEKQIFLFSAPSKSQLDGLLKKYVSYLQVNEALNLNNMAYTLFFGRAHFKERVAIIAEDKFELEKLIQLYLEGQEHTEIIKGNSDNSSTSFSFAKNEGFIRLVKEWVKEKSYGHFAPLWANGLDLDWGKIFTMIRGHKIPIPGIVFNHKRHWLPDVNKEESAPASQEKSVVEPQAKIVKADINKDEVKETIEQGLADILKVDVAAFTTDTVFADLNINSLVKIRLMNRLNEIYNIKLRPVQIVKSKSITEIAECIKKTKQ